MDGQVPENKMTKAYDVQELGRRLKEVGLDAAEETLVKAYPVIKQWLKESAAISKPMADDVAFSFVDQLDPIILPQIDKIDGKVG